LSLPAAVGAVLLVAAGVAHSYLGERYILIRLFRRPDLPHLKGSDVFTKRVMRLAWHATSVAWWGFAAVLLAAAYPSARTVASAVALTFLATGLIVLVGSRGRHFAWPFFLAVALCAWLVARAST